MITIYEKKATKFHTNGLGVLIPSSCTVTEEANGQYELDMVHPMGDDLRYTLIEPERIIKVRVPVRLTPFTTIKQVTNTVTYTVNAETPMLARDGADSEELELLAAGDTVTLMSTGATYHLVTSSSGETGYVLATDLTYTSTVAGEPDESKQTGMIRSQLFRIYRTEKDTKSLTIRVYARHLFYDLLWHSLRVCNISVLTPVQDVLTTIDAAIQIPNKFRFYTDSAWKVKKDFSQKNVAEALLDPEEGLVNYRKPTLKMVRDNFNVFLMKAGGKTRNDPILHGKNLLGATAEVNYENVYNRITPICQNSAGAPYYYTSPTYIDSPLLNTGTDIIRQKIIKYDDIKIGQENDDGVIYTTTSARTEMAARVAKEWASGIDKPEYNMKVDFVLLGDTEEYAAYSNLDRLYIHDTVQIIDSLHDISVSAAVTGYEYDVLTGRYLSMTLGSTAGNRSQRIVSGYQIKPGSIPGAKIATTGLDLSLINVGGQPLTVGPRNYLAYSDFGRDALALGWTAENATVSQGAGNLTYPVPASAHGIWSAPFTPPTLGQWTLTFFASGPEGMVLDDMRLHDIDADTEYDLADYIGWVPPVLTATRTRYEITFTATDAITAQAKILFGGTDQTAGNITIDSPMLARGNVAYDWLPAPEDSSRGVEASGISIGADHVDIYASGILSATGSSVVFKTNDLQINADDTDETEIMSVTPDGVNIGAAYLYGTKIRGDVVNTHAGATVFADAGIQTALDSLGKYLNAPTTVYVNTGTYNEHVVVSGFFGDMLTINFQDNVKINGSITVVGNGYVYLNGGATVKTIINHTGADYTDGVYAKSNARLQAINLRVVGKARTSLSDGTRAGIHVESGAAYITNCMVQKVRYGILFEYGGTGHVYNCTGGITGSTPTDFATLCILTSAVAAFSGSHVGVQGTLPTAPTVLHTSYGTIVGTAPTGTQETVGAPVTDTAAIFNSTGTRMLKATQTRTGIKPSGSSSITWNAWGEAVNGNWGSGLPRQGTWIHAYTVTSHGGWGTTYSQTRDLYYSVWMFGTLTNISSATQIKMTIKRSASSGPTGAATFTLYRHNYSSAPTGSDYSALSSTGITVSLARGEMKTIAITGLTLTNMKNGLINGFGLHSAGGIYAQCDATMKLEVYY